MLLFPVELLRLDVLRGKGQYKIVIVKQLIFSLRYVGSPCW